VTVIVLTGTPGTGKTAVARLLAKRLGYRHLELNRAIARHRLYSGWDRTRRTYIADMRRVTRYVKKFVTRATNTVVESHLAHELPSQLVDRVVVLRCRPEVLRARLNAKGWPKLKVDENVEAELIGLIAWEARQRHRGVVEVDATRGPVASIAERVQKALKGETKSRPIDWLK